MPLISYRILISLFLIVQSFVGIAQSSPDSLNHSNHSDRTIVKCTNGELIIYKRPKPFSFITQIPKTLTESFKMTVSKKGSYLLGAIAGSTLLLMSVDQNITDATQQFGRYIDLDATRSYRTSFSFKLGRTKVDVYDVPDNTNSFIYSLGEGMASVLLSGGMFTYGKIKRDYRAIQTASQILQAQLAVGILTQSIKRISGRESPFRATASGGVWRPFPGFREYQNNTSRYDAFPSGHLATMMATFTIVTSNYPEKKWITPVGIGLMTLVSFSMINNGVHWVSDYPLALGIGYVTGKATVKLNRWVQHKK
jgi:hypothetical protein